MAALLSLCNLGGSSKVLALIFGLESEAHGLGLPGASSHWNGIEAVTDRGGGVSIPAGDDSASLLESERKESFGMELVSHDSAGSADPIPLSLWVFFV